MLNVDHKHIEIINHYITTDIGPTIQVESMFLRIQV